MIYKLEKQEIYKGYHLVCVFIGWHRCGYVGLPTGHKDIGKHYYDVDFYVHGGLTFSEKSTSFSLNGYDWYFGFDCGHCDDGADIETMKKYGASESEFTYLGGFDGEIRTKEYVMNELYELVEQLVKRNEK